MQFYALSEELFHNSIQRRFTGDIFLGHLHLVLLTRNEIQTSCFLFAQNFMLYHRCTGCGAKRGAPPPPPPPQDKKNWANSGILGSKRNWANCMFFIRRETCSILTRSRRGKASSIHTRQWLPSASWVSGYFLRGS